MSGQGPCTAGPGGPDPSREVFNLEGEDLDPVGVAKSVLVAWTPYTTNMAPLINIVVVLAAQVTSNIGTDGVPRVPCHHYNS